jgi:uncharacterized membrane protein
MRCILARCAAILLLSSAPLAAAAQTAPNSVGRIKEVPMKMPDVVCWGGGPSWSIQFGSWGARYVGVNQPDKNFSGHFYWAPEDKAWVWQQRSSGLAPMGRPNLSAVIKGAACVDPIDNKTYRYSAQVNLPEGTSVSGCCRKLKPGDAPIGPHGVPPNEAPHQ